LQLDEELIQVLRDRQCYVAIETNGTMVLPEGIDWICVSPKANTEILVQSGNELKIVYPQQDINPLDFKSWDFEYKFIQPMDSETQELMEKIQELMEELDKDQMIQEMENLDISEEAMEKNTERLLELFKTLEVEKEVKDLSEKLQEMSEKQDSLSQESSQADQKEEQEAIKEEQDKLNEEFEKMQEKMDEILEKNSELERPKDLSDDNKEKMDDIKKDMQNSSESLEEQQNKQASQKQKKASEKMKEMAERMSSSMSSGQMQQMQEDMGISPEEQKLYEEYQQQ